MVVTYAILSVIIVSFLSVIFAVPFLIKKKISDGVLLFLLSVSVGVLLSTVFMGLLPESVSHKYTLGTALYLLSGFFVMFILEKFVHFHHNKKCEQGECGHGHAYNLAPVNLVGDAIHNFIDGLVIAGSYAVSISIGISATISIIFHEIPQEIADMGVLLYSGLSKKKAVLLNFLSSLSAVLGTFMGLFLIGRMHGFTDFMLPFAAGNFIYIAASNLVPQLHRQCCLKDTIIHIIAMMLGVAIIVIVTLYGPAHVHG